MKRFSTVGLDLVKLSSTHSSQFSSCKTQNQLVDILIKIGLLTSDNVIDAFRRTDRSLFLPKHSDTYVEPYHDKPIRIAHTGATLSTPTHHALIAESIFSNWRALGFNEAKTKPLKVVDIGCGTGYLSVLFAILFSRSDLVNELEVIGYEAVPDLAKEAEAIANEHFCFDSNVNLSFTVSDDVSDLATLLINADIAHIGFSIDMNEFTALRSCLHDSAILLAPVNQKNVEEQQLLISIGNEVKTIGPVLCQPKLLEVPEFETLEEIQAKLNKWVAEFEKMNNRKPSIEEIRSLPESKELFQKFQAMRRRLWT